MRPQKGRDDIFVLLNRQATRTVQEPAANFEQGSRRVQKTFLKHRISIYRLRGQVPFHSRISIKHTGSSTRRVNNDKVETPAKPESCSVTDQRFRYLNSKSTDFSTPTLHPFRRVIDGNNSTTILHHLCDCCGLRPRSRAKVEDFLSRTRIPRGDREIGGKILHLEQARRKESREGGERSRNLVNTGGRRDLS